MLIFILKKRALGRSMRNDRARIRIHGLITDIFFTLQVLERELLVSLRMHNYGNLGDKKVLESWMRNWTVAP